MSIEITFLIAAAFIALGAIGCAHLRRGHVDMMRSIERFKKEMRKS